MFTDLVKLKERLWTWDHVDPRATPSHDHVLSENNDFPANKSTILSSTNNILNTTSIIFCNIIQD